MRYFIRLCYNGSRYHGWQRQPNDVSVQQTLEEALQTLLRVETPVTGAGRTDAGVHAEMMVAHFDTPAAIQPDDLVQRLNALLPQDIAVHQIWQVADEAHARFDAQSRRYEYRITFQKAPFLQGMVTLMHGTLDFELMNQAAAQLLRYTDFTSFSKLHTQTHTNICHIKHAAWMRKGDTWIFSIEADRFLRNMVRAIVGTLLEVGRHKIDIEQFCKVIEQKDRQAAGTSVPAEGLYLVDIKY